MSEGASARLAALVALGAAVLAAAVLVATLFTSLLAVAAAAAALVVAGGCAWIALTRSGLARMLGVAAAVLAVAASATALYLGGAGLGVAAFLAAIALFTVAARSAVRRSVRSRRSAARGTSAPARDAGRSTRAVLLMNPRSGGGKVERFHLAQEAKRRGIETIELGPGDDLRRLAVDAVASADAIGMAGGDGSQALVADVAMRHNVPYVCVPAGTRNHLALDLGLDRDDVVGALDGFVDGVAHRIDVGLVNGRLFVNNVSLGVYAEAVRSDAYRDAKLATLERTLPELLGPGTTPMDLRFTDGEGKQHETAQLLMVSNNPYRLDDLTGGSSRPHLDTGLLGILAVEITSSAQAAELLALEAIGRARNSGGWLEWSAPTLVVDSSTQVAAGIDGESMMLEPPLRFEIVPQALTVLLPPSAVGVSPAGLTPGLSLSAVRELWGEVRGGTP